MLFASSAQRSVIHLMRFVSSSNALMKSVTLVLNRFGSFAHNKVHHS